jgi:hypothetical protein
VALNPVVGAHEYEFKPVVAAKGIGVPPGIQKLADDGVTESNGAGFTVMVNTLDVFTTKLQVVTHCTNVF